jgi:hypothetical protein
MAGVMLHFRQNAELSAMASVFGDRARLSHGLDIHTHRVGSALAPHHERNRANRLRASMYCHGVVMHFSANRLKAIARISR